MKRSNELRCDDAPEASQQSGGECYSSDRRLGGGGCWYRTAITHNIMGTSALWVPSTQATAERSPPLIRTHTQLPSLVLLVGALIFFFSLHFLFFPLLYMCARCVSAVCATLLWMWWAWSDEPLERLLYDCFSLSRSCRIMANCRHRRDHSSNERARHIISASIFITVRFTYWWEKMFPAP